MKRIAKQLCSQLQKQDSLLSERGEEDILVDAFKDGSSVICQKCQALVPVLRIDAHRTYWCSEAGDIDQSDED